MSRFKAAIIAVVLTAACGAGWNPKDFGRRVTPDDDEFVLPQIVDPGAGYVFDPAATIPTDQRTRFRNPDGSCVQCSIGMAAVHHACKPAEMLLWNSQYGRAVRGGSSPSRVAQYCRERNIPVINTTQNTLAVVDAALRSGRMAAIKVGSGRSAHMITVLGITGDGKYAVCDNNSPSRINYYTRAELARRHTSWAVVLLGPIPAPWRAPPLVRWWEVEK